METESIGQPNALVIEGGAMRSVFSAGLLDGFLEKQFNPFDCYIGVSAGTSNLAAFMAGTAGKSLEIFLNYAQRKEFISYPRFLCGGHLMDLEWLFHVVLTELELDLPAVYQHGKPLVVGLTDVTTGEAIYVNTTLETLVDAMKASMALPMIYRGFPLFDGRPMTDGGVADGIPVLEAIRRGAKKIMVVRSRHQSYLKTDTWAHRWIRWKLKHYPALVDTMRGRVQRHAETATLLRTPPPGIQIIDVCPPDHFQMSRFSQDCNQLLQGYEMGLAKVDEVIAAWND